MGIARILIISLSISSIFGSPTLNGRIFNGHTAKPGQFPYIVSINRNDNGIEHLCGGSILNNYWIVTAAHCLIYWSGGNYEILSGTNFLQSRGIIYNVSNVIVHPDYNPINHTNDITLIKINGEFAMNEFVQTIQIGDIGDNEFCTVIGWGKNEHMEDPNALQFTQLTTLSFNDCNKLSEGGRFVYGLGYGQVCAMGINATGPCFGDSGGPLVANGKLVGIVSYAITPCAQGYPDVYTRVSDYKDWINEILQNF